MPSLLPDLPLYYLSEPCGRSPCMPCHGENLYRMVSSFNFIQYFLYTLKIVWPESIRAQQSPVTLWPKDNEQFIYSFIYSLIRSFGTSFIHSFIPDISIAHLQVHYSS